MVYRVIIVAALQISMGLHSGYEHRSFTAYVGERTNMAANAPVSR